MARQPKENVDYFPFICKEGKGMSYIKRKHGMEGYCVWVQLLRTLSITNNHWLNLNNAIEIMFLSAECLVEEKKMLTIIDDLGLLGEINNELWSSYKIIWNQKLVDSIEDAYSKRNNKCWSFGTILEHLNSLGILNEDEMAVLYDGNPQRKVKESKEEQSKVKQSVVIELPFKSESFLKVWNVLIKEKKWKGKSENALIASAHKLSNQTESDAIQMMLNAIEGNWQGLFELQKNNNKIGNNQQNDLATRKAILMDRILNDNYEQPS